MDAIVHTVVVMNWTSSDSSELLDRCFYELLQNVIPS